MTRAMIAGAIVGVLAILAIGWAVAGCATASGPGPCMGCVDPLAKDCKDPSAHPPLKLQLPPWPYPRLFVPIGGSR